MRMGGNKSLRNRTNRDANRSAFRTSTRRSAQVIAAIKTSPQHVPATAPPPVRQPAERQNERQRPGHPQWPAWLEHAEVADVPIARRLESFAVWQRREIGNGQRLMSGRRSRQPRPRNRRSSRTASVILRRQREPSPADVQLPPRVFPVAVADFDIALVLVDAQASQRSRIDRRAVEPFFDEEHIAPHVTANPQRGDRHEKKQ